MDERTVGVALAETRVLLLEERRLFAGQLDCGTNPLPA